MFKNIALRNLYQGQMKLTQDRVIRRAVHISGIESSGSASSTKYFIACTREVLGSNLGLDTHYSDWAFPGFLQSLLANSGIILQLGHNWFLPNPF
jgi:hypothetical protein